VLKDRSGAVIAGAKVVAAKVHTNLTEQSLSGSDGSFSWRFLSAYKRTLTKELMGLDLRECFNLFSHTQFMNPHGNIGNSNFK